MKNRVLIDISGREFALITDETEDYMKSLAAEVNKMINESAYKNIRTSKNDAALLICLDLCDRKNKLSLANDNMRSQITAYVKEIDELKEQLEEVRQQLTMRSPKNNMPENIAENNNAVTEFRENRNSSQYGVSDNPFSDFGSEPKNEYNDADNFGSLENINNIDDFDSTNIPIDFNSHEVSGSAGGMDSIDVDSMDNMNSVGSADDMDIDNIKNGSSINDIDDVYTDNMSNTKIIDRTDDTVDTNSVNSMNNSNGTDNIDNLIRENRRRESKPKPKADEIQTKQPSYSSYLFGSGGRKKNTAVGNGNSNAASDASRDEEKENSEKNRVKDFASLKERFNRLQRDMSKH